MAEQSQLVELLVEHWRLLRLHNKAIGDAPIDKQKKMDAQWQYCTGRFKSLSAELGFKVVEYEGAIYSANLPVVVVNVDDFTTNEGLVVRQTIEPTVVYEGRVVYMGKVILAEGERTHESGN